MQKTLLLVLVAVVSALAFEHEAKRDTPPNDFNWKTQTSCSSVTADPMDQGGCNNCGEFAFAGQAGDRYCIKRGVDKGLFSPLDLSACCTACWAGPTYCDGTDNLDTLIYLKNTGVRRNVCRPWTGATPACSSISGCVAGQSDNTKYKCDDYVFEYDDPGSPPTFNYIRGEIWMNGPVQASMEKYADFDLGVCSNGAVYVKHTGGFYSCSHTWYATNDYTATHSIKLIGWHIMPNNSAENYWIAQNSYGTGWGVNGIVKIKMGQSVLDIENRVSWCVFN
jgi:hypothetical protein